MQLTNQDIWLAFPKLMDLSKAKFPLNVSMGIAELIKQLQLPYATIEERRGKLVSQYGVKDKRSGQVFVPLDSPQCGDFSRESGELLIQVWDEDIPIEKVKLPQKIAIICATCEKELDIDYLIEPQILIPLKEKFIEV